MTEATHMPQKFPGAARRDFTRNRVKGPKFSGATRRNPTNRAKRPKIFRRYAPGDPPPDFPTHIKYVSTALFSNLGPELPPVCAKMKGVVAIVGPRVHTVQDAPLHHPQCSSVAVHRHLGARGISCTELHRAPRCRRTSLHRHRRCERVAPNPGTGGAVCL